MKASVLLSTALVGLVSAMPMTFDLSDEMIAKLKTGTSSGMLEVAAAGTTANEFLQGGCRPVIFLYARGSTQDGNIGGSPGPQTIDQLKATLGETAVAAQGLDYPANLLDNLRAEGCDPDDAANFRDLITKLRRNARALSSLSPATARAPPWCTRPRSNSPLPWRPRWRPP